MPFATHVAEVPRGGAQSNLLYGPVDGSIESYCVAKIRLLEVPSYGISTYLVGKSDILRFEGKRPNQGGMPRPLIRRHIIAVIKACMGMGVAGFFTMASMALLLPM